MCMYTNFNFTLAYQNRFQQQIRFLKRDFFPTQMFGVDVLNEAVDVYHLQHEPGHYEMCTDGKLYTSQCVTMGNYSVLFIDLIIFNKYVKVIVINIKPLFAKIVRLSGIMNDIPTDKQLQHIKLVYEVMCNHLAYWNATCTNFLMSLKASRMTEVSS